MWLDILSLIGGLVLILLGAHILTDGSASLARRFEVSDLVIGLTIVAFGTSAPELVISTLAAYRGSPEIAAGNAIGSNIANVLLIIGCTALVRPIRVGSGTLSKEIPLVILSALVVTFMANDVILDGAVGNIIGRADGLLLLGFFMIFMRYTFAIAHNNNEDNGQKVKVLPIWKTTLYIVGGLVALIFGGQTFVSGASGIATSLGVSESVIGLTLVAVGTSLPELATSVAAALKNNADMAVGNVIGSNLFNIFFILGCSATIAPLPLQNINNVDMAVLTGSSVMFWLMGQFIKKRTITRMEGTVLVCSYVAYTAYLIMQ